MDKELHCLTSNVYFEARGEPFKGKVAVALVTLNRQESGKYPKSICAVVHQKKQFSWTAQYRRAKVNKEQWEASKVAAITAMFDRGYLGSFKATHFHNTSIKPNWKLNRVAKIGNHIFYAS
jgi:spore germination cell wall hydrolase CwlJ-like protein